MGFSYLKSKLHLFHGYHTFCLNNPSPLQHLIPSAANLDRSNLNFRGKFVYTKKLILPYYRTKFLVPSSFAFLYKLNYGCLSFFLVNGLRRAQLGRLILRYSPSAQLVRLIGRYSSPWLRRLKEPRQFFLATCIVATVVLCRWEKVPVTNRRHLVISTDKIEKYVGDRSWESEKEKDKENILPPTSPESVRVMSMMRKIVEAMHSGLGLENDFKISYGFVPDNEKKSLIHKESSPQGEIMLANTTTGGKRRRGRKRGGLIKYGTRHLEGLNWEVMVIRSYEENAFYLPHGKVVVYTGELKKNQSDDALAAVLGHEAGHGVGRHQSEFLIRSFWLLASALLLVPVFKRPNCMKLYCQLGQAWTLFISRRRELEADRIGLILMAMAGYDPRTAPAVLGDPSKKESDWLSTHPNGQKRHRKLSRPKVMEEAVAIYNQVKAGQRPKIIIN